MTLHSVVFVLSYSRLMYVGLSFQPLDTPTFIQLHDEAFRYFGGITEECVHDQTKLVVIKEQYREIEANQRFYQYVTTGQIRRTAFIAEERPQQKPYLAPSSLYQTLVETGRADKTGLISYQANKYSVPLAWLQARVGVVQQEGQQQPDRPCL